MTGRSCSDRILEWPMDCSAKAPPQRQHAALNQWPLYGVVSHRVKHVSLKRKGWKKVQMAFLSSIATMLYIFTVLYSGELESLIPGEVSGTSSGGRMW